MRFKPRSKVKVQWTSNFAYAIGLIASDGNLSKDGRHIFLKSADRELIENFMIALNIQNNIGKSGRGGTFMKNYFHVYCGDVRFYKFLNEIGIQSAKSKIIKEIMVPRKFFADFFRGLFDGDGTFYTFWDKRWSNSFVFKMSVASASPNFIKWVKKKLTAFTKLKVIFIKAMGCIIWNM